MYMVIVCATGYVEKPVNSVISDGNGDTRYFQTKEEAIKYAIDCVYGLNDDRHTFRVIASKVDLPSSVFE